MPVKAKKTTTAKKAKKAKKLAVKRTAKKSVAKKSRAKKTVKKHKQGKRKPAKTSLKKLPISELRKTHRKTAWKISPENSQSVVEIDIWKKDDLKIEFLKVYRSGWIIVDQLPDLSGYNPDEGINIFEEFEFDEHQPTTVPKKHQFFQMSYPQKNANVFWLFRRKSWRTRVGR